MKINGHLHEIESVEMWVVTLVVSFFFLAPLFY